MESGVLCVTDLGTGAMQMQELSAGS